MKIITRKIIFVLMLTGTILLRATPALSQSGKIVEIRLAGLSGIDESLVRDVIPFKVGDPFNLEELDLAVNYLRKWGVFDEIEATTKQGKDGIIVKLLFKMSKIISQVDLTGNYPYLENKILKHFTLSVGDSYTRKRVDEQVMRIKEIYEKNGFVGTEVTTSEKELPSEEGVGLTYKIKHGDVLKYRKIEVHGNRAYPLGRFTSALNTWIPFSERRLQSSIRKLLEFYHFKGYPRAKIRVAEKKIDYDARRVDVVLEVDEGPKVKVHFEGYDKVSRKTLKKAITIFKEGSYDSYEIENSVQAIQETYKNYGYPDAKVRTKKITEKDSIILIIFTIDEGPPRIVKKIGFQGNEHMSSRELRKAMSTRQRDLNYKRAFDPSLIGDDSEAIRRQYRKKGFYNVDIGEWKIDPSKQGFEFTIKIPLEEGPQIIVGQVGFKGISAVKKEDLLDGLKVTPEKPLSEEALIEDRDYITNFYADHGHPYAQVKQNVVRHETGNIADIVYEIDEGSEVRFGSILITGDVLTSQKAIKNTMGIKEGSLYSRKKIIEGQLHLRHSGAFSAVKVEPLGLSEKKTKVHILVDVDEQKTFLVDIGLGYSTDQSFTGSLTFKNLNSFGWAKQTVLKLVGGRDLSRVEVGWLDPAFLGSSFEMYVNSWLQYVKRPVFKYIQPGAGFGFARRYRRFDFLFRYDLERDYFVEGSSSAADAENLRNSTISKITLSSIYDSRDSFSDPRNGWYTFGGVNISDEIKGNESNFVKFGWRGENDFTWWRLPTLSTAVRFGRVQGIGNNVIVPINELLFLGGNDTIRGFYEDSLGPVDTTGKAMGATTRWILNEELRFRLFKSFSLAGFFDMGSLTYNFSQINWSTIRRSAGAGLRYVTPVGPIRLDYGIKLDRKTGETFGRLHFTFGYVF